ncbi:hypothetical protein [Micromonospora sp. NPDC047730]|uniref:hypothetical protein n=1 Tax=Micromonospora sp. NPDC047730 TaxID=3364253 RepID=UPI003713140A
MRYVMVTATALAAMLPEQYEQCKNDDRWTLVTSTEETCATVGRREKVTHVVTWGPPDGRTREGCCDECAGSYSRRPALAAQVLCIWAGWGCTHAQL